MLLYLYRYLIHKKREGQVKFDCAMYLLAAAHRRLPGSKVLTVPAHHVPRGITWKPVWFGNETNVRRTLI
jgi:hypothetical protein